MENSYAALEAYVKNAIPAIKYELNLALAIKADVVDLNSLNEEKASLVTVEALVKRLNEFIESVKQGNFNTQAKSRRSARSEAGRSDVDDDEDLYEVEERDEEEFS